MKIIDFNVSKRKRIIYDEYYKQNVNMFTHLGTLEFSAPETVLGFGMYSEQIDMWSAGIILYYLLCGYTPFRGEKYKFL